MRLLFDVQPLAFRRLARAGWRSSRVHAASVQHAYETVEGASSRDRVRPSLSRGSNSNGEKNNELGPEPSDFRGAASQNPSPAARFEKTHSRTVIENQDPAESRDRGVRAWGFSITVVHEKAGVGRSLFFSPLLSEPQGEPRGRSGGDNEAGEPAAIRTWGLRTWGQTEF